jgi:hypothetical protein
VSGISLPSFLGFPDFLYFIALTKKSAAFPLKRETALRALMRFLAVIESLTLFAARLPS